MIDQTELLSDQVFQLNTMLWALEELPDAGDIHPVLREAGYYLNAIGKGVVIPPDPTVREVLADVTKRELSSPRPDLWLKHQTNPTDVIVELKARGFSPESKTAIQALKLLAASADLEASVGGGGFQPGHVVYVTANRDAATLGDTLIQLHASLVDLGISPAPTATIGLEWVDDGVALVSPRPEQLPAPAQAALSEAALVLERDNPDDDVVPLYFIPWIPGIEDSQDADLHSDGLRELTARLLTQTIAELGQASVPTTVAVSGGELLGRATFGVFPRWRDTDRKMFAQAAANIIERTLRATDTARLMGDVVEIDLPKEETRTEVLDRLERADPADPTKNLEGVIRQPTLFDNTSARPKP